MNNHPMTEDAAPEKKALNRLVLPFLMAGLLAGFFFGIDNVLGQLVLLGTLAIGCIHVLASLFGSNAALVFAAFMAGAATWNSFSAYGWSIRVGMMAFVSIGLSIFALASLFGKPSSMKPPTR
jgi:uncharacterized membrane protein